MVFTRLRACAAAVLACTTAPAFAQPAAADPTDPAARVPPLRHAATSPTAVPGIEARDWREAHALVGRIGGWRSYAREAAAPAPAAASATPAHRH